MLVLVLGAVAVLLVIGGHKRCVESCGLYMNLTCGMIIAYSEKHGEVPEPNKWCDFLMESISYGPKVFLCPESDAVYGESSYAMNKNLAGMKIEDIPNDVVVLFESDLGKNTWKCPLRTRAFYKEGEGKKLHGDEKVWKYRWNQFGGPEILTTSRHKWNGRFGCRVAYIDNKYLGKYQHVPMRWVAREDLDTLKWKPNRQE